MSKKIVTNDLETHFRRLNKLIIYVYSRVETALLIYNKCPHQNQFK